jgi:hypothetical protein
MEGFFVLSIRLRGLFYMPSRTTNPKKQAPNEILETAAFDFIQFLILDSFHWSLPFELPGRKRFVY